MRRRKPPLPAFNVSASCGFNGYMQLWVSLVCKITNSFVPFSVDFAMLLVWASLFDTMNVAAKLSAIMSFFIVFFEINE